jgi:hypothetical protein
LKAISADWNKWKTEFQVSKTKYISKKIAEEYLDKNSRAATGICTDIVIPSKDQICES